MIMQRKPNGQGVQTEKPKQWQLRLYVAGKTPKSVAAFSNLTRLCEEHLADKFEIEVIDLIENPRLARDDQIVAIPTLVRKGCDPSVAAESRVLRGVSGDTGLGVG